MANRSLALVPRHRAVLGGATPNTAIRSPIAAIRAGAAEEVPAILQSYRAAFAQLENGFSLFEQVTPGYQAHSIEHLGLLTMILQEALLQSVSPRPGEPEVIRVFPACPPQWNASFRLLARGGFLVSSEVKKGRVQFVEIESRLGEECRLRNPWEAPCLLTEAGGSSRQIAGEFLRFPTQTGKRYRLHSD